MQKAFLVGVEQGMDLVGQRPAMRNLWRGQYDVLVNYLAIATAPKMVGIDLLRQDVRDFPGQTTIAITGERCSGARVDGSDSPILLGMAQVANALAFEHCVDRTAEDRVKIVFSGGIKNRQAMGEFSGDVLAAQFNALTENSFNDAVEYESLSRNTGEQARILAAMLFARRPDRIVFVHVKDTIARFAATVMFALRQLNETENFRLSSAGQNTIATGIPGPKLRKALDVARRTMPKIFFVSLGDWEDRDPRRGKGKGISRAQEAFGPIQTEAEVALPGRFLGGEYAERYYKEQSLIDSIGMVCPALSPWEMLGIIPSSTRHQMGASWGKQFG